MLILLCISIFLILYTYFGYLFLVIIMGRLRNKIIHKSDFTPNVAFMISAYNEEKGIEEKLLNTLSIDYPKEKFEIIVVSDGSTDKTDEIVKNYASQGVRLIRVEGRVGKTEARNIAIKMIKSEIVIFSDGTTEYDKKSVQVLVRNFSDSSVGMVSGHLKYIDPAKSQVGAAQKLFWKYESIIKKSQTKMGTLTGSIGCITAFRRTLYTHLPANVIEDFTGPLFIVKQGFRVVFEEEAICYELTTQKSSNEWNMRVRVIRGGMTGLLFARGVLNPFRYPFASFQLISHKLLRWFVPIFLITAMVSNVLLVLQGDACVYISILLVLQCLFYTSALMAFGLEKCGIHFKIIGIPLYFVIVNSASFVAIYKTMTSTLGSTWETER
ncbi:MAG: cellulose synthase/poly-beta-1,6-N-acetylglucosamine synthase-like glycosyltransferase [Bacteriovoracaceae bacterium]|jgi:cellulose synthase/poly-beta-1,6-N-acetylglucosamine synthase-like glycosyltransferase